MFYSVFIKFLFAGVASRDLINKWNEDKRYSWFFFAFNQFFFYRFLFFQAERSRPPTAPASSRRSGRAARGPTTCSSTICPRSLATQTWWPHSNHLGQSSPPRSSSTSRRTSQSVLVSWPFNNALHRMHKLKERKEPMLNVALICWHQPPLFHLGWKSFSFHLQGLSPTPRRRVRRRLSRPWTASRSAQRDSRCRSRNLKTSRNLTSAPSSHRPSNDTVDSLRVF